MTNNNIKQQKNISKQLVCMKAAFQSFWNNLYPIECGYWFKTNDYYDSWLI